MILETASGRWLAYHMPTNMEKTFTSYLAAKTWMLVMDDRTDAKGWQISCEIRLAMKEQGT